ncbi:unnamed protein product, partial [Ectocarpus sp. 12 AP-2014]
VESISLSGPFSSCGTLSIRLVNVSARFSCLYFEGFGLDCMPRMLRTVGPDRRWLAACPSSPTLTRLYDTVMRCPRYREWKENTPMILPDMSKVWRSVFF